VEVFRALFTATLRSTRDLTLTGVLKWMVEPLSFMFIYFVLVASVLARGKPGAAYPLFLLCALVPWRFFTGAVNGSMSLVNRFSTVLTGVPTPKPVLPLVLVATEAANMLVALVLFVPMVLIYDVDVWPSILWLPLILAILVFLTTGPTYLATVFGLYFPDFRGVAQNLIRAGFFVSTALVPISLVPGKNLRLLVMANPMSSVFDSFRTAFGLMRTRSSPELFDLVYPFLVGGLLLVVGLALYFWRERHFPKEV
jgi:ABC-type polysaccharide/polyol phosphate export permease